MTTALTGPSTTTTGRPPLAPPLGGIWLGSADRLLPLVRAALEANDAPARNVGKPVGGYMIAVDAWSAADPPDEVCHAVSNLGALDGRPVGLIACADDVCAAVASVAVLSALVSAAGGLPVSGAVCLECADLQRSASDDISDVTVFSRLVLLGRRVQRLAASRVTLRNTA